MSWKYLPNGTMNCKEDDDELDDNDDGHGGELSNKGDNLMRTC